MYVFNKLKFIKKINGLYVIMLLYSRIHKDITKLLEKCKEKYTSLNGRLWYK